MENFTRGMAKSLRIASKDEFVNTLLALCDLSRRPASEKILLASLPSETYTLNTMIRACKNAGINATLAKRRLDGISENLLPVVLFLNDGTLAIMNQKEDELFFFSPNNPELSEKEIIQKYTGYVLLNVVSAEEGRLDWYDSLFIGLKKNWLQTGIASFLVNCFVIVIPLYIMNVYDRVVPNKSTDTLWVLTTGVMIVIIFELIIRTLRAYFIDLTSKSTDIIVQNKIFYQLQNSVLGSIRIPAYRLASELRELESLRDFFTNLSIAAIIDFPFMILFLAVIYYLGGSLVLIPIVGVFLIMGVNISLQGASAKLVQKGVTNNTDRHQHLIETLRNLMTIKIMGAEGFQQRKWEHLVGASAYISRQARLILAFASNFTNFVQHLALISVVFFGAQLVMEGKVSVGGLIATTILTSRALGPISTLGSMVVRFSQAKQALSAIRNIFATANERSDQKNYIHLKKVQGDLEFRRVSFVDPENLAPVFDNLNLKIKPGERVAIVGKNRSGKSSLTKLAAKLAKPTAGAILLDGIDIQNVDHHELREQVLLCPQSVEIFKTTLKENLLIANPAATDEQILDACRRANLMDIVNSGQEGIDLDFAKHPALLTSEIMNKVGIARVFLKSPKVLIMDEPAGSIDPYQIKSVIKDSIKRYVDEKGCSLILITHHNSMLELVNRVVVLESGKIVRDTPRGKF